MTQFLNLKQKKIKMKRKPGWARRQIEYINFLKEQGIDAKPKPNKFIEFVPNEPYRRKTPDYPSLNSTKGDTNKVESPQYSGDYLIGIATMHKSNAVPVGKEDQPENYSTMRRN